MPIEVMKPIEAMKRSSRQRAQQRLASHLAAGPVRPVEERAPGAGGGSEVGRGEPGSVHCMGSSSACSLHREVAMELTGTDVEALRAHLRQASPSHVLVDEGRVAPGQVLEAEGYCQQRRWGQVALWKRCAPQQSLDVHTLEPQQFPIGWTPYSQSGRFPTTMRNFQLSRSVLLAALVSSVAMARGWCPTASSCRKRRACAWSRCRRPRKVRWSGS
jgi:hypothetical protein